MASSSSNVKKFHLVDEDEYQRQKFKELRDYNPELMARVRRELNIQKIINSTELNSEQKLRLIRAEIYTDKYLSQPPAPVSQLPAPIPAQNLNPPQAPTLAAQRGVQSDNEAALSAEEDHVSSIGDQAAQAHEISPDADEISTKNFDNAISKLGSASQKKARLLKDFLNDYSNAVTVSDNNEMILNGNLIKGSNMTNILKYLYNPQKSKSIPSGIVPFVNLLHSLNAPTSLFPSNKFSKILKSSQTGKGFRKIIAYAKFPKSHSTKLSSFKSLGLYKV